MSKHRYNNDINEVKSYFNAVIDWVSGLFKDVEDEMCGLEWGRLRIRRLGVRIPSRAQVKLSVPFTPGAFLFTERP